MIAKKVVHEKVSGLLIVPENPNRRRVLALCVLSLFLCIFSISSFAVHNPVASCYSDGILEDATTGSTYGALGGVLLSADYGSLGLSASPTVDEGENSITYTVSLQHPSTNVYIAFSASPTDIDISSDNLLYEVVDASTLSEYDTYAYYSSSRQTYTSNADKSGYTWYRLHSQIVASNYVITFSFKDDTLHITDVLSSVQEFFGDGLEMATDLVEFVSANFIVQLPLLLWILISLCLIVRRFIPGV